MDKGELEDLQLDDRLKMKALYNKYRGEFLNFAGKYNLDQDSLSDIYQDSFLALRKLALSGKLDTIKCSMKTYLFGIGKHKVYNMLKKKQREIPYEPKLHLAGEEILEIKIDTGPVLNKEQTIVRECLKELGEKCRKVLTLFYYRGLSIKEIAEHVGYGSENVVKAQKSRCLKTLKQLCNR
ncbi:MULTISPECIES: RNA polymerase sigma factor [Cellulophaga]|uniref:RNA polymerase sigma factor n=1 Tax=Cellulophaga TaxID=104264 RepID=UPI0037CA44A0